MTIKKRTKIVVMVLAFVFAMVLIYIYIPKMPIKIAYVGALSGSSSDLGNKSLNGVKLAVDQINSNGGLLNRQVELIVRDTAAENADPETIVKGLKSEGVKLVIGLELSSIATKYLPYLNTYELLSITSGASSYTLDRLDDYLLRVNLSDKFVMKALSDYASNELDLSTIDFIYSTNNLKYVESSDSAFFESFKLNGGSKGDEVFFESNPSTNYKAVIQPLKDSQADGILIVANDFDTATIIQQLKLEGVEKVFLTSAWSKTNEFITFVGNQYEGIGTISIQNPNPEGEAYQRFITLYENQYSVSPDFGAIFGYDAMQVLLSGIENAGVLDGKKIKNSILAHKTFNSVYGDLFEIDSFGDVAREVWVVKIENGQYVKVTENENK